MKKEQCEYFSKDAFVVSKICSAKRYFAIPVADPRGGTNYAPPLVQILSFSCSFQQKVSKIIGWRNLLGSLRPLFEILDPSLNIKKFQSSLSK